MRNVSFRVVSACLAVLASACGVPVQESSTDAQSQEPVQQQQEGLATGTTCNGPVGTLFLDGDVSPVRDYIHPGADVITNGTWNVYVYSNTSHDYLRVDVTPANSAQGLWWDVVLSSQQLRPAAGGGHLYRRSARRVRQRRPSGAGRQRRRAGLQHHRR